MLEAGQRVSAARPSAAGRGAALRGRPVWCAPFGQGSVDVPAGKLQVPLDDVVDTSLPLEGEVDAYLSKQRARRPGEVVWVAREAVADGLAGGEDRAPVRAVARRPDHIGRELAVDRSAELVHGASA